MENIFEHGLDAGHTVLKITIRGQMEDSGFWRITIKDNGAGMEESALSEMKREIFEAIEKAEAFEDSWAGKPMAEGAGMGIKNTLIRLSLFYGGSFKYIIENGATGGFCVILEGKEDGDIA